MSNIIEKLVEKGLAHPPRWLPQNVNYLVIMGSEAYGVSSGGSDIDVYGYCMPPKHLVFPHLAGEIPGFGTQIQRFEQYQEHHIKVPDWSKEYDLTVYSIVKFFHLCMGNNPNMLSALNVPQRCVLFASRSAVNVRDKRDLFLCKGSYQQFRGYAYSQLHKLNKPSSTNERRQADIDSYGFDTKFAYHIVRLALECEQILTEGHLDVDKNSEILKSIRRGEWSKEKIISWFDEKEKHLEELKMRSTLPDKPPEEALKALLMECIEDHYGSMSQAVATTKETALLHDLEMLFNKYSS